MSIKPAIAGGQRVQGKYSHLLASATQSSAGPYAR
jgi:hypothetical protein